MKFLLKRVFIQLYVWRFEEKEGATPIFPKLRTKDQGDRYDLELDEGKYKIFFMEKYATIQLMGDILVGIFFVTGSVLNLFGTPAVYGNIAYLIGSLSLAVRPTIKTIRRMWISNKYKDEDDEDQP